MRRRTFIAALPGAALRPGVAGAQGTAAAPPRAPDGPGQGGAPATDTALPPRWVAGEDRFLRPDVSAGDRPVGASFASRTAA